MSLKKTIICLGLILGLAGLCAQEPSFQFRTLSIDDGLSQNSITCLLQDGKGFMWFGTQDGLNRFDGYQFKKFKTTPQDENSISDNYIVSMIKDAQGHLWLATEMGVNEFIPDTEQFIVYYGKESPGGILSDNHTKVVYEAPCQPGIIWIATEQGLDRLDSQTKQVTHYRHDEKNVNSLGHDIIRAIYQAPSKPGILWLATRDGLSNLHMATGQFTHYRQEPGQLDGLSNNDVRTLYEAPSKPGQLWVGTAAGLDCLNIEQGRFSHYYLADGLGFGDVRALFEPSFAKPTLWIGTYGGGVKLLDLQRGSISQYLHKVDDPQSLADNFVLNFFQDRSKLLWIGTELGGVCQFSQQVKNFQLYRPNPDMTDSLSDRTVRSIFASKVRPGSVWVATYGGLDLLDSKRGTFSHFRQQAGQSDGLVSNLVRAVMEDRQGRVWVGTHDAGVCILDFSGKRLAAFRHYPNQPNSLSHDSVRCFMEDHTGQVWLGTAGGGLSYFDEKKQQFIKCVYKKNDPSRNNERLYQILEDRQGRIWLGTAAGLDCFDPKSAKAVSYQHDPLDAFSLSNNMVMSLYEDSQGQIWAGTWGGGLNRFDQKLNRFDHFTEQHGLANNVVYGILEDEMGNLWLSTNNGLSKMDPRTVKFKNYDVTDGLQSNEFNANAYFKGADGVMYFGGINGLTTFLPSAMRENYYIPPLVITDFQIANRSVPISPRDKPDALLVKSVSYSETLHLTYRHVIISFEYSALSYVAPGKNHYAYMMEGLEESWNYVGNRRFVTYTNLPPGAYLFKVKGANRDGAWNEIGTSIKIIVSPPFWKTLWFRGFFGLFFLLLIYLLFALRTRSLSRRKRILEQIILSRTRELTEQNEELARLSLVARHTDNSVLICDASGNIEWINEGFNRMYGYTFEQLRAEKGGNLLQISYKEDIQAVFNECVSSKKPVIYEYVCFTRSGQQKWAQTLMNPILDGNGQISRLILVDTDITLLKEATQLAERERIAAQEANQAKSNFLARMSHEIRTPMNGVIGFTDILLETPLSSEQCDYVHTIKSSGEALLYLINDILDFSKIEAGKMDFEKVDFNFELLVGEACEIVAPRAEFKAVELVCRIGEEVPQFIKSDPQRLRQVLINLLDNALKFTQAGVVDLSISLINETKNDSVLEIKVRDSGQGIPADKLETIFNVFTQGDESISRQHGGTGLGLSICRQIARQMGGEIRAESELGQGSTFTFTAKIEYSNHIVSPPIPDGSLEGKRVLIVDDNSQNLQILTQVLMGAKMIVNAQSDPKEVIGQLQKAATKLPFDICIIDILMPELDGFSLARMVRSLPLPLGDLPLLAYSSSATCHIAQYREAGFSAFLIKPIQKRKLLQIVHELVLGTQYSRLSDGTFSPQKRLRAGSKRQLLLAEDNRINQKLIRHMLKKTGHSLTIVNNGLEVIQELEKNPQHYDLIFMDIHMPVMDGLEATRRIRERGYDQIPIIALTADSMKGDREKYIAAGMNDYLSKPVKGDELMLVLRKWSKGV